MQAFRDGLFDCGLEDLGLIGDPFTWKRGRIRERLDRAVVNNEWRFMHPGASLKHLEYIKSDHRPILLDTEAQPEVQQQRGAKSVLRQSGYVRKISVTRWSRPRLRQVWPTQVEC
jgi:hypothetical protein